MTSPLTQFCDTKEMHRQQRVKVSGKYLPVNKNLKLKMTSYITLKYISYKSVLKKNFPGTDILFMVQYIQIQQYNSIYC